MKQSDRTIELRHALVTTADAAPYQPRTSRRRGLAIASIAAFALAGAATGGAVATNTLAASNQPTPEQIRISGQITEHNVVHNRFQLFGKPFNFAGSGTTTINIGVPPNGATGLAFGLDCLDLGSYDMLIDGVRATGTGCPDPSIDRIGGTGEKVDVNGSNWHTMTITGSGSYIVWAQWAADEPIPPSSAAQVDAMADGVVTRDEYVAGFDRYLACMEGAGYHVTGGNRSAAIISYAFPSDADDDGTDQRCYDPEYKDIDAAWQIAHLDESSTTQFLRDCLTAHGITPAHPRTEVDQQLKDNGIDYDECQH